jgi:multiple sugar transport system ATP-binding protein
LESTMVYVTHDQVEAMTMADTIVVLREGVVEQVGAPIELYARPRNKFVACFLGTPQMNLLKAKVHASGGKGMSLRINNGHAAVNAATDGSKLPAGADCTVGIRPEHLAFSDDGPISGTVLATEMLGSETIIFATLPSGESLTASIRGIRSLPQGSPVHFSVGSSFVHVFDAQDLALPSLRSWREDYLEA